MSDNRIVIPVDLGDAIPRPREAQIARRGVRRLVKLAPVLQGAPVIWTSPSPKESTDEEGRKIIVYDCIVLVTKDPRPETMRVEIPTDLYEKLHDVPVEW